MVREKKTESKSFLDSVSSRALVLKYLRKELIIFSGLNKTSPRHGGEIVRKKKSKKFLHSVFVFKAGKNTEAKKFLDSFFSNHFSPMSRTLFFSDH